jgi:hypothetical protein
MSDLDQFVQCPPGMSPWGWLGGTAGDDTQWTGTYLLTVLPTRSDLATVSKCLPAGLHADPSLVTDGGYPVLLLLGNISDAQNRVYPFIGMNYLEIFSAIPGVYLDTLDAVAGGFAGPFLYPYRGYLSHLIPTILGWLASYPKSWQHVEYGRKDLASNHDSFRVTPVFGSDLMLTAEIDSEEKYQPLTSFPRFPSIEKLLSPNIIHEKLIGKGFARSAFDLSFLQSAVAWNLPSVDVQVNDPKLFPGMVGSHSWRGLQGELYGALRLAIAWRLIPQASHHFKATPWPPPVEPAPAPAASPGA